MAKKQSTTSKTVETIKHEEATRKNIPTAEYQSVLQKNEQSPVRVAYERRNRDLDPQLVWRGKDEQDRSDLIVHAPPLYIQEKVHPKALIDDLLRQSKENDYQSGKIMADLFSDFNGIPKGVDKTEFYQHDQNWSNRMILGDSLQVMASLAEREGLRGKVQCIYFDPPYGIKFNSNFQWSTTTNKVMDGNLQNITREPEQVKAFRDTWKDGVHSYLTYLRDRLTIARDLLAESGSLFLQISDENVHLVRVLLDEIFGDNNSISTIAWKKSAPTSKRIKNTFNYILWYAKNSEICKVNKVFRPREANEGSTEDPRKLALWGELTDGTTRSLTTDEKRAPWTVPEGARIFRIQDLEGTGERFEFEFKGKEYLPRKDRRWRCDPEQFLRLKRADRISITEQQGLGYKFYILEDAPVMEFTNLWDDTAGNVPDMVYVVQTNAKIIARCIHLATDPGDLVLDPTCGSGTTATVAEQWGRRWITIDTSRVALALARARLMAARYPYYFLKDSLEGQIKEAELYGIAPSTKTVLGNIRHGFVYQREPHITLKAIANNLEIDVIWDKWQKGIAPLIEKLNTGLKSSFREWEIPRYVNEKWTEAVKKVHADLWHAIITRQKEINKSIAEKANQIFLYDKAYDNPRKVRVAGPFTVESLSPHRTLGVDENDELIDPLNQKTARNDDHQSFVQMIFENLKIAGVQQAHKEDKITFISLIPWPGNLICAEGRYMEGETEKRAAIFIGPEFGTVQRIDLVTAAREAGDAGFDVLITCAFNYDAHTTEFNKLGRIPVLKARMNADLHMASDLKNTGKGNLFVIFGEPDINIIPTKNDTIQVRVNGVDVFHPNTGEVRSDGADGIACWFIDTDYNEESFFVRHAYFLGANDPYNALKTTLKAEINKEAWASLHSDTSRPFPKPKSGRIAVKVINHLGDEVLKVFKIA